MLLALNGKDVVVNPSTTRLNIVPMIMRINTLNIGVSAALHLIANGVVLQINKTVINANGTPKFCCFIATSLNQI